MPCFSERTAVFEEYDPQLQMLRRNLVQEHLRLESMTLWRDMTPSTQEIKHIHQKQKYQQAHQTQRHDPGYLDVLDVLYAL